MIGRRPFPLLLLAPAFFLFATPDGARAQEPRFVLREIIHAPYTRGSARPPDQIEVRANEGFVDFTVDYSGNCRERYRFEYSFDQDMNALPFDSDYGFSTAMRSLEGRCQQARDPFVTGTSSNGGFSGVLNSMYDDPAFEYRRQVKLLGGGMPRLYTYGVSRTATVGTKSGAFGSRPVNLNYDGSYSWLGFSIQASSNKGEADSGFYYDIIYIYEQVNDYEAPLTWRAARRRPTAPIFRGRSRSGTSTLRKPSAGVRKERSGTRSQGAASRRETETRWRMAAGHGAAVFALERRRAASDRSPLRDEDHDDRRALRLTAS